MPETMNIIRALDPRGLFNEILQARLSERLDTLEGKTLYIIHSWQQNTGFEEISALLEDYLYGKHKGLKIEHRTRLLYSSDDPELWAELYEKADAFVYFAAPSCSTTAYAVTWPARALERNGIPGLTVLYTYLLPDAMMSKEREGMEIRHVCVPYPCDGISEEEKREIVAQIEDALFAPLTDAELACGIRTPAQPPRFCAEGSEDSVLQYFFDNGLTDGLPVVLPTPERVETMLQGTSHLRDEVVVTQMAPEGRKVTVEKVAINAVMAGAEPCYMPVLLAVTEIMGRDQSFHATTKSTNSFSYMQVVNGPIRNEIGMNSSVYALGAGNRANAVIGRFLRLALLNLGGGKVGANLMGVQGNVSSYTFAFAENEEASPWESYGERRGFRKDESSVTVFTGGWAHCGNYMLKKGVDWIVRELREFEYISGVTVLLAPRRAALLAAEGCKTLSDVEEYFWSRITMSIGEMKERGFFRSNIDRDFKSGVQMWPPEYQTLPDDAVVPLFPRSQVSVIVVGDPKGSDTMQGWSMNYPRSASVDKWR